MYVCFSQVTVTVTDENDNAPAFSQEMYLIHVPDPTAPGQSPLPLCVSPEVGLVLSPFSLRSCNVTLLYYIPFL